MDSPLKPIESEQPSKAVPCSALVLLLARWRDKETHWEERSKWLFEHGKSFDRNNIDGRLAELRTNIGDLEELLRAGMKGNAEVSGPPPVTPESKQSANGGFAAPIY